MPGQVKACALPGQTCDAVQTCNSDGAAYGECACPGSGAAGAAGASSSMGGRGGSNANPAGGAGGGGNGGPLFDPIERAIGAPCATSADCPTGPNGEAPLRCIPASDTLEFGGNSPNPGGPQGGYCTADCTSIDDCQALDGLSACAGTGFCLGLCQPGDADGLVKCFADRAQACVVVNPNDPETGACLPICQSDAGCGAGLFCDLGRGGLGLCTAVEPPGGDVGAPCTEATAETDCKSGLCLTFGDAGDSGPSLSFCSANCTNGSIAGCGFEEQLSVPRDAVCAQSQLIDGGPGDIGFCFELCDVDADCAQAAGGWICSNDLNEQGQMLTGRTGLCLPPEAAGTTDAGL
jgi:hypothetical protein